MLIHLEDKKLIKRLLAGDERAFNQFFDENYSRLYRFTLVRLSGEADPTAEIVQGTLSKALRKIRSYRGEAALFTWLCTICRNEIADWARKNARYREHVVLTEDYPDIRAAVESLNGPESDDPGHRYQRYEAARLIQVALDRLPPRYGDALEWKYIQGFSVREIAQRMNVTHDAAQSILARAKRAFQEIYSTLTGPVFNQ